MKSLSTRKIVKTALSCVFCAAALNVWAGSPIEFNPDGQGADALTVGVFDWFPGSALVGLAPDSGTPPIPLIPDSPTTA